MKTQKNILIAVIVMVLFAAVSSSFAKPKKRRHVGKGVVRNPHYKKVVLKPQVVRKPHRQKRIVINPIRFRVVFTALGTRIVVTETPKVVEPAEITVWITNDNCSLTAVTLTKHFPGYIGPLGEYYPTMPTHRQLKILYGLKPRDAVHLYQLTD